MERPTRLKLTHQNQTDSRFGFLYKINKSRNMTPKVTKWVTLFRADTTWAPLGATLVHQSVFKDKCTSVVPRTPSANYPKVYPNEPPINGRCIEKPVQLAALWRQVAPPADTDYRAVMNGLVGQFAARQPQIALSSRLPMIGHRKSVRSVNLWPAGRKLPSLSVYLWIYGLNALIG